MAFRSALLALLAGGAWWVGTGDALRTWAVVTAVLVVSCPCAIALAFHEVRTDNAPNPYRDDMLACYGLESRDFAEVMKIAAAVGVEVVAIMIVATAARPVMSRPSLSLAPSAA